MKSGWVAPAGPDLVAFEQEVAERCGVPHAVALSSGTAALHLALVSWGVGPGDVVVTSTMTFAATANVIRYVGAEPYFVDCDPATANMDPDLLDEALTYLGPRRSPGRRGHAGGHAGQVLRLPRHREGDRAARRTPAVRRLRVVRGRERRPPRGVDRRGRGAVVQRQQDHDHLRRRHAAHPRRGPGRQGPLPLDPGEAAGRPLRAHRHRLQLPAVEHPRRPRPGTARPAGRDAQ